jgi:two-component system, NarL family, nitrate/nitrite response regulator NarL
VTRQGRIRLVLVEPLRLIRDALQALLKATGDVVVVGEATGASDLMKVIDAHHPDVVLITLDAGGERELALLQQLPKVAERARTLVLTSDVDVDLHARVIELGAMGVVLKTHSAQQLLKAVQKIHAGELWLDRAEAATIVNRLTRKGVDTDPELVRISSLTGRERQIVVLITEGLSNKDISERLYISEATARNHVTSILDKLELTNRFQLVVYAFRRGLVSCPQTPAILRGVSAFGSEPSAPRRGRKLTPPLRLD